MKQILGVASQQLTQMQAVACDGEQRHCLKLRTLVAMTTVGMPIAIAVLFTALLTTLSGCAVTETTAPHSPALPLSKRVPVNAAWRMQAKVAVKTTDGIETASMSWHRADTTRDTLVISGPLGWGSRTLIREGSELGWLHNGQKVPLNELSLEAEHLPLIASLPLKDLALRLTGHGLDNASDEGWIFSVASWQLLSGYTVPRKLRAQTAALSIDVVILSLTVEPQQ